MKTKILLLISSFLILFQLQGQIHFELEEINVDSLHLVISELNGMEKVDAMSRLSKELCLQYPDSSITIAHRSINLSEEINYQKGIADGYFNLGNSYYILDEFRPSTINYLKALRIYEDLPPSIEAGTVYLQLGDLNYFTGRYRESLPYIRKALINYEKLDHEEGKLKSAFLIAYTHWIFGDSDSSFYYTKLCLSYLGSDADPNKLSGIYMHYARTCRQQFVASGDTLFLDKTIQWLIKAKDLQGLNCYQKTNINYNLGEYSLQYKAAKKKKEGIDFFYKAIPIAKNCKEAYFTIAMAYRRLGKLRHEQGDLDTAVIFLNKALVLIEDELSSFSIKDYAKPVRAYEARWFLKKYKTHAYWSLYNVYLSMDDYEQALENYKLWKKSNEERYVEKNKNLIDLLEANSENEKTNHRINMLTKENELKALRISQSRIFNYGLAGLIVLLFLLGFLILRQNKLKAEHKTVVLEQKLLRLQMNPHFIFNALSNILNFIDSNENKKASGYLITFSKLLRTTLESTREDLIPFEKEVSSLKNYLELQKLRYSNKFDYIIEVDENIGPKDLSIPPMLVQPFIENAIEHGIRHKKTPGQIDVRFFLEGKKILCEVEDDGVGRKKAWETEVKEHTGHKSLATEIIKDRIKVLNKKFSQKIRLEVIDKISESQEAMGTTVLIDLPYENVY